MLRLIILFISLCSFFTNIKPNKPFVPPGTARVNDSLYVDIHEVTQRSWHEYRSWVKREKGENSLEYKSSAIDTSVWLWSGMTSNQPYMSQHRHLDHYKDYPVVGVTYEQVLAFCEWRSQHVLKQIEMYKLKGPTKMRYRLPTESEWQTITGHAEEIYTHKNTVKVKKYTKDQKIYHINYAANSFISDTLERNTYTVNVGRYKKNPYGCYDLIGNVSEMVAEKGISKGGSFKHTLEESRPDKLIQYASPQPWLGFRCVCIAK